jgi:hypothetical protein
MKNKVKRDSGLLTDYELASLNDMQAEFKIGYLLGTSVAITFGDKFIGMVDSESFRETVFDFPAAVREGERLLTRTAKSENEDGMKR